MATSAQILANQENAKHSTGPKTPEGKAKVAANRTSHGLAGRSVLLPGEDPTTFHLLLARLTLELVPANTIEETLVNHLAHAQWKLNRIAEWEAALTAEGLEGDPSQPSRLLLLFSKSADASEALPKLQRYQAQVQRTFLNFHKELRLSKSARHRAATTEAATTTNDINNLRKKALAAITAVGLKPQFDDSKPIPGPEPSLDQPRKHQDPPVNTENDRRTQPEPAAATQ